MIFPSDCSLNLERPRLSIVFKLLGNMDVDARILSHIPKKITINLDIRKPKVFRIQRLTLTVVFRGVEASTLIAERGMEPIRYHVDFCSMECAKSSRLSGVTLLLHVSSYLSI